MSSKNVSKKNEPTNAGRSLAQKIAKITGKKVKLTETKGGNKYSESYSVSRSGTIRNTGSSSHAVQGSPGEKREQNPGIAEQKNLEAKKEAEKVLQKKEKELKQIQIAKQQQNQQQRYMVDDVIKQKSNINNLLIKEKKEKEQVKIKKGEYLVNTWANKVIDREKGLQERQDKNLRRWGLSGLKPNENDGTLKATGKAFGMLGYSLTLGAVGTAETAVNAVEKAGVQTYARVFGNKAQKEEAKFIKRNYQSDALMYSISPLAPNKKTGKYTINPEGVVNVATALGFAGLKAGTTKPNLPKTTGKLKPGSKINIESKSSRYIKTKGNIKSDTPLPKPKPDTIIRYTEQLKKGKADVNTEIYYKADGSYIKTQQVKSKIYKTNYDGVSNKAYIQIIKNSKVIAKSITKPEAFTSAELQMFRNIPGEQIIINKKPKQISSNKIIQELGETDMYAVVSKINKNQKIKGVVEVQNKVSSQSTSDFQVTRNKNINVKNNKINNIDPDIKIVESELNIGKSKKYNEILKSENKYINEDFKNKDIVIDNKIIKSPETHTVYKQDTKTSGVYQVENIPLKEKQVWQNQKTMWKSKKGQSTLQKEKLEINKIETIKNNDNIFIPEIKTQSNINLNPYPASTSIITSNDILVDNKVIPLLNNSQDLSPDINMNNIINIDLIQKPNYDTTIKTNLDVKPDTKTTPDLIVVPNIKRKSSTTQKPKIITEPIEDVKIIQEKPKLETPQQIVNNNYWATKVIPKQILIPKPIPFYPGQSQSVRQQGFDVFARVKGIFQKINVRPLNKTQAINFGANKVDFSSLASFKIEKSSSNDIGTYEDKAILKRFGRSKQNNNIFVEKSKFRINTPGELKEITFKGITKNKAMGGFKKIKLKKIKW